MLSDCTAIPTLATSDLERAKDFYEQTLGFAAGVSQMGEELYYASGSGGFLVYRSQFAGTNKATALMFQLDEGFDAEVARLREAGVTFDTFDLEGLSWDDGVGQMDGGKAVWFHDPDGNIINLMTTSAG